MLKFFSLISHSIQYMFVVSLLFSAHALALNPHIPQQESMILFDKDRQRTIPVELYFPENPTSCLTEQSCPVALLSPGYGVSHLDYSFIASDLTKMGYLVVSIQHQLPSDLALIRTGNIFNDRIPVWKMGAKNIHFVLNTLRPLYLGFDWQHPVLIGHSNGGDISALFAREENAPVSAVITLDNRRVALPRESTIKVLSIRASDFDADEGVLPTKDELHRYGMARL